VSERLSRLHDADNCCLQVEFAVLINSTYGLLRLLRHLSLDGTRYFKFGSLVTVAHIQRQLTFRANSLFKQTKQ